MAPARPLASTARCEPIPTQTPRRICERMTPELPRAPIKAPWEALRTMTERSGSSSSRMSSTADWRVSSMLVPVSPSGTGKTLRASTSSRLSVSQASEPSNASLNSRPSHCVMGMDGALVIGDVSAAATTDVNALHIHIHLNHRQAEGPLDRIPDRIRKVMSDFGDTGGVLEDDVERDRHPLVAHLDFDPAVKLVAMQPLRQAIAQAAGSHPHHPVAAGGRMPGNGGDDVTRYLDPPEVSGLDQRPRRLPGARRIGLRL